MIKIISKSYSNLDSLITCPKCKNKMIGKCYDFDSKNDCVICINCLDELLSPKIDINWERKPYGFYTKYEDTVIHIVSKAGYFYCIIENDFLCGVNTLEDAQAQATKYIRKQKCNAS